MKLLFYLITFIPIDFIRSAINLYTKLSLHKTSSVYKITMCNIKICFPDLSDVEKTLLAKESFIETYVNKTLDQIQFLVIFMLRVFWFLIQSRASRRKIDGIPIAVKVRRYDFFLRAECLILLLLDNYYYQYFIFYIFCWLRWWFW